MNPTPEQLEAVAKAICEVEGECECASGHRGTAYFEFAVAAYPIVRAQALEEAASLVETEEKDWREAASHRPDDDPDAKALMVQVSTSAFLANLIRALK